MGKQEIDHLFTYVNEEIVDDQVQVEKKADNYWVTASKTLLKNKWAMFSLLSILFLAFMSFAGPMMNSHSYKEQDVTRAFLPPKVPALENVHWLPFDGYADGVDQYELMGVEEAFWFGTDQFGRDQWTRVWYGTRISLFIAFVAAIIDVFIGVTYGGISGYFGGRVDNVMQRIIEILVGIPNLVIIILAIIILKPGLLSIIIAIVLTGWVSMARVVRGQVLKLKNMEYVLASKTLGLSNTTILVKDILPNSM